MLRGLVGLLAILSACSRSDADGSALSSAAGTVSTSAAVNASRVARYPDEVGPTQISTTIAASVAEVRTGAGRTGDIVAGLARGSSVTEVVQRGNSVLVLFSDPTDRTRTLEGWVSAASIAGSVAVVRHHEAPPNPAATATPSEPHPTPTPARTAAPPEPALPAHGLPIKIMPVGGKCSAGYVLIESKYCRLSCRAGGDCAASAGATCRSGECYAADE